MINNDMIMKRPNPSPKRGGEENKGMTNQMESRTVESAISIYPPAQQHGLPKSVGGTRILLFEADGPLL